MATADAALSDQPINGALNVPLQKNRKEQIDQPGLPLSIECVVGQTTCPDGGGPLGDSALVGEQCGADVRRVLNGPLVVRRVELY